MSSAYLGGHILLESGTHRHLCKTLCQHLLGSLRLRLVQSQHRRDHTASSGGTFEEMGLEHVLAVVPGLAIFALEGSIGRKSEIRSKN